MQDLINEQMSLWLRQYALQTTNQKVKKDANALKQQISSALNSDALLTLLKKYTQQEGSPTDSIQHSVYGPINFYATLLDWQRALVERKEQHGDAVQKINAIKPTANLIPLLLMIQEILEEPLTLLNTQINPFLRCLAIDDLEELFAWLATVCAPCIELVRESNSAKIDSYREYASTLLKSITTHYEKGNQHWHNAHLLVSLTLKFYTKEMGLVEINLSEGSDLNEQTPPHSGCVVA